MSKVDPNRDGANVTHSTHIGSVTGQVHTGSGDIHVNDFSVLDAISNKEGFIVAL